ncbi:MAG: 16S rRNA (uracil(1498)-N(3))-methyltransferase [Alphaproteobacteria bacterium GM202ARS2]|nr:16S rRNA (uracil(1498)-N(3))-methyltransferase [Alphaproteobacteria bacterium GM202ARS2]
MIGGCCSYKARLKIDGGTTLKEGATILFDQAQHHKLFHVLRLRVGDNVCVFDGKQGAWLATIDSLNKKSAQAKIISQHRNQHPPWHTRLLFAVLKQAALDDLIDKATQMAVGVLQPVITDYTVVRRINHVRLHSRATQAAEQCNRLDVPKVEPLKTIQDVLKTWDKQVPLYVCDPYKGESPTSTEENAAFLIGPEGGFSQKEYALFDQLPDLGYSRQYVRLAPLLLRAETAATVALASVAPSATASL